MGSDFLIEPGVAFHRRGITAQIKLTDDIRIPVRVDIRVAADCRAIAPAAENFADDRGAAVGRSAYDKARAAFDQVGRSLAAAVNDGFEGSGIVEPDLRIAVDRGIAAAAVDAADTGVGTGYSGNDDIGVSSDYRAVAPAAVDTADGFGIREPDQRVLFNNRTVVTAAENIPVGSGRNVDRCSGHVTVGFADVIGGFVPDRAAGAPAAAEQAAGERYRLAAYPIADRLRNADTALPEEPSPPR